MARFAVMMVLAVLVALPAWADGDGAPIVSYDLMAGERLLFGFDRDGDGAADIWRIHPVYWRGWTPASDEDLKARALKDGRGFLATVTGPEPMNCGNERGADWRYVYLIGTEPLQECLEITCGAT